MWCSQLRRLRMAWPQKSPSLGKGAEDQAAPSPTPLHAFKKGPAVPTPPHQSSLLRKMMRVDIGLGRAGLEWATARTGVIRAR
jgi:hypothetical protein